LLEKFGVSAAQAINIQVRLGLLPGGMQDALPAAATAGVARDLGWLAGVADGRKPFAAVTHCLCGYP
jgi:protease-4